MHWNLVYTGAALAVAGCFGILVSLSKSPTSGVLLGFSVLVIVVGLISVVSGAIGLVRIRSEAS
jgi:hypothetical protein